MFRDGQMGVYIHWPFCAKKCPYCDFNSHVREEIDQEIWAQAYVDSLKHYAQKIPNKQIVSIFFGGGTPSLMRPQTVQTIIDAIQSLWSVANDIEITLEANPTSVEADKFEGFKTAGVNRISMGVQAFNDEDLVFLGREHNVSEAKKAIDIARSVFDRYSFDLIYGRPNQSTADWTAELSEAIPYTNGHMSLYQLTIERNTPFYMRHSRGEFKIPDEVKGAEFYHLTQDIMSGAGLPSYEVSNHAAPDQECKHNMIYWNMADYIGVGAGAHGRFMIGDEKYASRDHAAPEIWLERAAQNGTGAHALQPLSQEDRLHEAVMMGLRLKDGLSIKRCESLSGLKFTDHVDMQKLGIATEQGWAICEGDNIRLTREGILRLNALVPYLMA